MRNERPPPRPFLPSCVWLVKACVRHECAGDPHSDIGGHRMSTEMPMTMVVALHHPTRSRGRWETSTHISGAIHVANAIATNTRAGIGSSTSPKATAGAATKLHTHASQNRRRERWAWSIAGKSRLGRRMDVMVGHGVAGYADGFLSLGRKPAPDRGQEHHRRHRDSQRHGGGLQPLLVPYAPA